MKVGQAGLLVWFAICAAGAMAQDAATGLQADRDDEPMPAVSGAELLEMEAPGEETPAPNLADGVVRTAATGGVMDELDLGRSEVTGNQELPKVLYIVPWQKSGPAELMGKPVNTLLEEVLAPIDRTEFVRQVDYYDELHQSASE